MEKLGRYVSKILIPDEEVLWVGKVSRFIYLPSTAALLLGALMIAEAVVPEADVTRRILQSATDDELHAVTTVIGVLGGILIFCSILWWLRAFIRRWSTELVITNRRVISKVGLISRQTWELNNHAIEGVRVNQSILGRIFNYGDLTVTGKGAGVAPVKWIDDPIEFRRRLPAE